METTRTAAKTKKWCVSVRFDESYLVDPENGQKIDFKTDPLTGERTKFKSMDDVWQEKERLEASA